MRWVSLPVLLTTADGYPLRCSRFGGAGACLRRRRLTGSGRSRSVHSRSSVRQSPLYGDRRLRASRFGEARMHVRENSNLTRPVHRDAAAGLRPIVMVYSASAVVALERFEHRTFPDPAGLVTCSAWGGMAIGMRSITDVRNDTFTGHSRRRRPVARRRSLQLAGERHAALVQSRRPRNPPSDWQDRRGFFTADARASMLGSTIFPIRCSRLPS